MYPNKVVPLLPSGGTPTRLDSIGRLYEVNVNIVLG
jgi:hypothetical protein